jgi:hypothetical protein
VRRIRTRRRRYWRFKELPSNGNLDASAHDGNLLDKVIDTDKIEKLRMAPSISIISWLGYAESRGIGNYPAGNV